MVACTVAGYVPKDTRFERDAEVVGDGEVEVETCLGTDVAVVAAVAYIVMEPSDTDESVDSECAGFATEATEGIGEVEGTVSSDVGVVKSGFAVTATVDRRGVDTCYSFNSETEEGGELFTNVQTNVRADVAEEGVSLERCCDTTVKTDLPVVAKCGAFDDVLCRGTHNTADEG